MYSRFRSRGTSGGASRGSSLVGRPGSVWAEKKLCTRKKKEKSYEGTHDPDLTFSPLSSLRPCPHLPAPPHSAPGQPASRRRRPPPCPARPCPTQAQDRRAPAASGAMGGCYSVIAASKTLQMQQRRAAAAILPVASSDEFGAGEALGAELGRPRVVAAVPAGRGAGVRRVRRHPALRGRGHRGGPGVQDDPAAAPAPARRRRGRGGRWRRAGVHLVMELCEGGKLFDRSHYTERAAAKIGPHHRPGAFIIQMLEV